MEDNIPDDNPITMGMGGDQDEIEVELSMVILYDGGQINVSLLMATLEFFPEDFFLEF